MRKILYYCFYLLLITSLLCCQGSSESQKDCHVSRYARISHGEWELLNGGAKVYGSASEFLAEVDLYVEQICEYLGIAVPIFPDERLKLDFSSTSGLNYHDGGARTIYLNITDFQQGLPPLPHELTHFLAPVNSPSLSEGLAQLVQGIFGKNGSGGNSVYRISRQFYSGEGYDLELVQQIGTPGGKYPPQGTDANKSFYVLSYSFTKYLVEQYGTDKFMKVYRAENILDKYQEVYGIGLEQLRAEWSDYVIGGSWLR